jgi:hypothetical protein
MSGNGGILSLGSDAEWTKLDFAERAKCRPILLRLSLAINLEKPAMSLYGTKWIELGFRLDCSSQGVTKRCRLFLLTSSVPHIRVQMRGGGSCEVSMSTAVHITWHGAQINFVDLPPYLTCGSSSWWYYIVRVPMRTCYAAMARGERPTPCFSGCLVYKRTNLYVPNPSYLL